MKYRTVRNESQLALAATHQILVRREDAFAARRLFGRTLFHFMC